MRAIEATGKVDGQGNLHLDKPPIGAAGCRVRVIILFNESDEDTNEQAWCEAAVNNPSFAFLHDEEEAIYSLNDGKPVTFPA